MFMHMKSGRATAPGARNGIKASLQADRIIEGMGADVYTPKLPSKSQLFKMICQARQAAERHKTKAAVNRLSTLEALQTALY